MEQEVKKRKRGGVMPPVNEVVLIPQIAALLALGKNTSEIAQAVGTSFNTVKKLAAREETKAILQEMSSSFKDTAKAVAMKQISEMTQLAVEGLKQALQDGNIQAIQTHFKVIGLLGAEDQVKNDKSGGTIQVILPGAHVEKPAIEVESE